MDKFEFYKMEYESLREEILASQAARRNLEQVGAGLIAALYAWLTTTGAKEDAPLADLAWWVPPAIAFGVAWRGNSLSNGVRKAGGYLAEIERAILKSVVEGPKGWHVELAAIREKEASKADAKAEETWLRRCRAWLRQRIAKLGTTVTGHASGIDSEKNKTNFTWYLVAGFTLALAGWVSFGTTVLGYFGPVVLR